MKTIKAIHIHHADDDEAAFRRHDEIEKRLEELGRDRVGMMLMSGGFPTGWNPIIHAWLVGERLEAQASEA